MRVICIDKDAWPPNHAPAQSQDVKIENGKTYTVVETKELDGYIWHELTNDIGWLYWDGCFIGTSDIDEKEFERNYNKELV